MVLAICNDETEVKFGFVEFMSGYEEQNRGSEYTSGSQTGGKHGV